jgi:integrase
VVASSRHDRDSAALEFTILTAARTGEAIGARRSEIDIGEKLWAIPPERMKAGREHRVPLSARALAILEEMRPLGHVGDGQDEASAFVFPGGKRGQPLSNMAFLMLLRRMKRDDLTADAFNVRLVTISRPRGSLQEPLPYLLTSRARRSICMGARTFLRPCPLPAPPRGPLPLRVFLACSGLAGRFGAAGARCF